MMGIALATLGATAGARGEGGVVDSGWAVATPAQEPSVIQSQRVPIRQLLPGDAIERITIPPRPPRTKGPSTKSPSTKPRATNPRTTAPRTASRQPVGAWRPRVQADAAPEAIASPDAAEPRDQRDISSAFALPGEVVDPADQPRDAAPSADDEPEAAATEPVEPSPPAASEPVAESPPAEAAPAPAEEAADTKPADALPPAAREPAPFPGWAADPSPPTEEAQPEEPEPVTTPSSEPPKESPEPKAQPEAQSDTPATEPNMLRGGEETKSPAATTEPETVATPSEEPAPRVEPAPEEDLEPIVEPPKIGIAGALRPKSPPTRQLTRSQQYLRRRLRSVLSYYYRRPLNSNDHNSWEVMHSMLSYGLHSRLIDRTAGSKPVTAIGYLCFNKPCKGKRLLRLSADGRLDAEVAYGIQGHHGQFLAMLAQCNVSPDYPVRVQDKKLTIRDVIEYEKRTCRVDSELSFKLMSLAHFSDLNETWIADDGERWTVSRLIDEERNQKIRGAACGGTHRLAGIALAQRIRVARGEPLDGQFLAAKEFTDEYVNYAFRLQNRDGSLSTEWFRGRGEEEDINRRIRTTGHLLEWLLYALPAERLTDSRTVRAVNYLTSLLASNTDNAWEIGPLSHALHALLLYDERVFQPHDKPTQVAGKPQRPAPKLAYQSIAGKVYGTYPSSDEAERLREEAAAPGGLRGLFGIGRAKPGRRSR
ncbi:MAG: hypothetical protein AAGJ46_04900 [Planctomycetota bacterium]